MLNLQSRKDEIMFEVNTKGQSILNNLLINPRYRIWRHILFVVALAAVSFNQTYVIFQQNIQILGNNIYWIALSALATYLIVAYVNIYVLIPKYLVKKKYVLYISILSVAVFLLLCAQTVQEDMAHLLLEQKLEAHFSSVFILNFVSSFATITLCMSGGSVTILLKHWITETKRVNQLEQIHVQSEVEQLKEQINPQLLFNILNRTGVLAKTHPAHASEMLMKLSHILRYQLYDCSRETVLLSAEMNFLGNYLSLERLYSNQFKYSVSAEGDISRIFVPPLLFIPFVQQSVIQIYKQEKTTSIDLIFRSGNNQVEFTCNFGEGENVEQDDFSRIKQRLDLLYQDHYTLSMTKRAIMLTLNIQKP